MYEFFFPANDFLPLESCQPYIIAKYKVNKKIVWQFDARILVTQDLGD